MRVKPLDFQRLNLRCHALLSDVPLHDVWAIPLNGGGPGRSIEDARAILFGDCRPPNFVVRGLDDPPSGSYVNRLAEADRSQSQVAPETREGPFRVLYVLGEEALSELCNATVHAFLALVLTPSPRGIHALLGNLREASESSHYALHALIDPFRRLVVYPALGRHAQQRWSRTYA